MPELTPKLGIKKPLGNETVSRAAFNENWDIIDQKAVGDMGGVPTIQAGLDTAKPTPGTAGRLYVATDTQIIYRDTGTAWIKVGVVKWSDIDGKPVSFTPSIHGNEAHDPDLALASDLAAHLAETTQDGSGVHGIVSTATITYYIDEVNGNDNNDGLSAATAFKTWAKARSKIPRIIDHNLTIRIIGNYSGSIELKSIVIGGGSIGALNIIGDTTTPENHIVGSLQLLGVFGQVSVSYLQISGACVVNRCLGIGLHYCNPRNPGDRGVDIFKSSAVRVTNCNFGTAVVQDAIWASESKVYSLANSGSATRYGLYASEGATIAKYGTQPTGATANEYAISGGVIR